ncbi:MAG: protein kinase [Planctomycetota bacterium]|nr:protein kinase [Planctomycetota bacterium]
MARLIIRAGRNVGAEFTVDGEKMLMGRKSAHPIPILDPKASREHAQVGIRDGKVYIKDLGSRNGTCVNGQKITGEKQLNFGDKIQIGDTILELIDEKAELIPIEIPGYKIMERIGTGGMGTVYKARQLSMDRIVALKVLNEKYSNDPEFIDRFIREARAAGKLNHPNVIHVHDVSKAGGRHYFSMEYIDGMSVKEMLRRTGKLPVEKAVDIVLQAARALEFAHEYGIIHRDIKPDNIMVTRDGIVKIADLGIAKSFDDGGKAGDVRKRVMGTPHYMAPEQALGKELDHRVDIYSLGATFYHMLTGATPFSGSTAHEVLRAHIQEHLPPIQELNPDVPDPVCFVVERMMAKSPDKRYANMTRLIEDLEKVQEGISEGIERIAEGDSQIMRAARPEDQRKRGKPGQEEVESTTGRAGPVRTVGMILVGMLGVAAVAVVVLLAVRKLGIEDDAGKEDDRKETPQSPGTNAQDRERREMLARADDLLRSDPASQQAEKILTDFRSRFPSAPEIESVASRLQGIARARLAARDAEARKLLAAAKALPTGSAEERAKAREALEAVVRDHPSTEWSRQADAEIKRLLKLDQDEKERALMNEYVRVKAEAAGESAGGNLIRARELLDKFRGEHPDFPLKEELDARIREIDDTLQRQFDDAAAAAKKAEQDHKSFGRAIAEWRKYIEATRDADRKTKAAAQMEEVRKRGQAALDAVLKDVTEKCRKFKYGEAMTALRAAENQFSGVGEWSDGVRAAMEGVKLQSDLHEKVVEAMAGAAAAPRELGFRPKIKGFGDVEWLIKGATREYVILEAKKDRIGSNLPWADMDPVNQYGLYRMFIDEPTAEQHKALAAFCAARDLKAEAEDHLKKAAASPAPQPPAPQQPEGN